MLLVFLTFILFFLIFIICLFSLSYLIQKGANVNALGGELMSAPVHWAAR